MRRNGFVEILTESECQQAIKSVDKLYEYWERDVPPPINSYTLGAVTYHIAYSDLNKQKYFQNCQKLNPIFNDEFGWIYKKALDKISEHIGPCQLMERLGYPGFHIFGHGPNDTNNLLDIRLMQEPLAKRHQDLPFMHHMNIWEQFSSFDLENTLSFTLTLERPENGAGLYFWDDNTLEQYEIDNEYSRYLKTVSTKENPHIIQYRAGSLFYFMGSSLWHQIAPAYKLNEFDRRITMQAHGVLCDGIWRIYF